MDLKARLAERKAQLEQAKANANFIAGQIALLEELLAEEAPAPPPPA